MQSIGATGKIYGLKSATTNKGGAKVTFRLSVRKQFVSEQDKQNNATNVFMPMIAYGKTAEFIQKHFNDGDGIVVTDLEYQTFRSANAPNQYDDGHIFNVGRAGFAPGGNGNGGVQGQPQQQQQQQYAPPQQTQYQAPAQPQYQQPAAPQVTAPAAPAPVGAGAPFTPGYAVSDGDLPF